MWIQDLISGIELKLYNTEKRRLERVKTPESGEISLYTCGPTVYSFAHIGNFRTYVFEDLLRRTLELFGFKVNHVMNITDVDDKTIKGAIAQDVSLQTYTEPYIKAFFDDLKDLGIQPANAYPAATDHIDGMIGMIEGLMEKKVAYKGADGSIYFSISQFPRYGCLSHLKLDELKVGGSDRVASDEYDKENLADFVLWKGYDPDRDGEIYWESPFGKGRPGWHLECSCMARALLGDTIDIHCGGVDNIFPHHENEIAQSEAFTGKTFAKMWLHSEHLIVDGKKMSKSLGNFYTLRDLLDKGHTGPQVRYMLMHTHYRSQLNFTFDELHGVASSIDRLSAFALRLREFTGNGNGGALESHLHDAVKGFATALADDLNISSALGALFDFVRHANGLLDAGAASKEELEKTREGVEWFNKILNVISFEEEEAPLEIVQMVEQRQLARTEKNWALADELRDKISSLGYVIEDTAHGPRPKKLVP